jgi:probable addiction module antidote protein
MTTETTAWNPFDYFESQEEINQYLADAFLDDDPRVFLVALGFLAKKRGMSEVAKRAGVNRENLYRSLSGKGNPEYATVAKVIRALDLKMIPGMKAAA